MDIEVIFRALTGLVLVSAISISVYFRRKAEREGGAMRSPEGRGLVLALRLYGLLALLPLFGYLLNPAWVAWARWPLPEWARWLGAGLGAAVIPLVYWVFVSLGTNISPTQATRAGHQLVTWGPYRWVRHPLYTTGTLALVALALLSAVWWIPVMAAPALAALWRRTPHEEARLIEAFGDDYRAYMRRTGRFLPKVG